MYQLLAATATAVELAWTAWSAVGVAVSMSNLLATVGDYLFIRDLAPRDAARGLVARSDMRTESAFLIVQLSFLGAGIISLILPPPVNPDRRALNTVLVALFVVAQVVLVYSSIMRRYDRRKLLAIVKHGRPA